MVDFDGTSINGDKNKVYHWTEKFNSDLYKITKAGGTVENQLQAADINTWKTNEVKYLTRQDWQNTYPT